MKRARRGVYAVSSLSLAVLAVLLLLAQLRVGQAMAQGDANPWPLTADGRSRVAGWSPDGGRVLVNRWGEMVGDDAPRQVLSELWAVDLSGELAFDGRSETAIRLSRNAIKPVYDQGGSRLAYLTFVGDDQWQVRVLDLDSTHQPQDERAWSSADWRIGPSWGDGGLAFVWKEQVWLSEGVTANMLEDVLALSVGARVGLSGVGRRIAWSDSAGLWVVRRLGEQPRQLAALQSQTLGSTGPRGVGVRVLDLAWSADGRRLAYTVAGDDLSPALWVVDVARGQDPERLVQGHMEVFSIPSWSPDGRRLAFSRAPLGTETSSVSDIWLVDAAGDNARMLLAGDLEESHPIWSPDGRYLAFNRAGDVWVFDLTRPFSTGRTLTGRGRSLDHENPAARPRQEPFKALRHLQTYGSASPDFPAVQQTPPLTIRVIHRENNTYRDVPVGQIDVITFETYVKRCVPVEMPALWPEEALKVQAVAARTYAWYHTKARASEDWDVSDWTDYQVMGSENERHPRSDGAVDRTRGQYVAYQGDVIQAFYSARNGSPTRSASGYDYIQAVDDPVSFWEERWGHGWGMSQWGAKRWVEWHGWSYLQVLAHYYTDITVELPATGGPMPIGGLTLPWSDYFVTGNHVYLVANGSDEEGDVREVGFYGAGVPTGVAALVDMETRPILLLTDTVPEDGWRAVWDVSALSDTASTQAITLSVLVVDGAANVQTQTQAVHIGLDRQPPTATGAVIRGGYTNTVTITLSALVAIDPSPGSGVQGMAFSNEEWAWEGEVLSYVTGTAEVVADPHALNGWTLRGLPGIHEAGTWYGPYARNLEPGRAYRAYFRLRTRDITTTTEIALLEIVDDGGGRLLGMRRLRGIDFRDADAYQEFPVDFNYTEAGTTGLEFRTAYRATADLYLDRVLVVGYPLDYAEAAQWRLAPGSGPKVVTIKFIDGAGNVSPDVTATVTLDTDPPAGWHGFAPVQWDGGPPPTCTVRVLDEGSGLNVDSARYRFSTNGGVSWSGWLTAACTGITGTNEVQTVTATAVGFDLPRTPSNRIQFQISDMVGFSSTAAYTVSGPLSIAGPTSGTVDESYTFTALISPITGTVAQPVTFTWQATDKMRIIHPREGMDRAVYTWSIAGLKTIAVTATNQVGVIGIGVHDVAIGEISGVWYVHLPLVMRDYQSGSLVLPH